MWRIALLIFVALLGLGLTQDGLWCWLAPLGVFGVAPLLDLGWPRTRLRMNDHPDVSPLADWAPYLLAAWQPVNLGILLWVAQREDFSDLGVVGAALSVGIAMAAVGLNVAHLLGHNPGRRDQLLALFLLVQMQYGHWRIEHNRGHHVRVGTLEDHATARAGESYYRFLLRGAPRGFLDAWRLEMSRVRSKGHSPWSWRNEILMVQLVQLALLLAIGLGLGARSLLAYLLAVGVAIALTESINYIQHYGLIIARSGRPPAALAGLSWNSEGLATRFLLLNLARHSDHHRHPVRHYRQLEALDAHPYAPTGHPGMILMALCPPLWFWVMNPRLEQLALE